MSDGLVRIFESTDNAMLRAIEAALVEARIAFELRRVRPTLAQMGPNKPPQPFYVTADDEAAARRIVETIVHRRGRIASLQPEPQPKAGDDDVRTPDLPFFGP